MDRPRRPAAGDRTHRLVLRGSQVHLSRGVAKVGDRVGEYELLAEIGSGGMGTVLRARHRLMNRVVAIKIVHAELLADDLMIKRFRREIEASARLSHPNVLTAFDAGVADARPYLVTEYLPGDALGARVHREGPMSHGDALGFVAEAARGLQAVHDAGIIHRDVKPANLMLDALGVVRVIDFGISKLVDQPDDFAAASFPGDTPADTEPASATLTGPGERSFIAHVLEPDAMSTLAAPLPAADVTPDPPTDATAYPLDRTSPADATQVSFLGTPHFAAPEQERSADVDERSDVYGLGATLFWLLTGEGIVVGDTFADIAEAKRLGETRRVADLRGDVPPGLDEVLARMTALEPGDRFASMEHVEAALTHLSAEPNVFISYRREDSLDATDRLYAQLTRTFEPGSLFLDVDTIPAGTDFREHIRASVGACDVMLVVIGDHWVRARGDDGSRRIDDPADLVRLEVESALAQGVPVIPVLVGRAHMPSPRDLPDDLTPLAFRNAADVRAGPAWAADVERLVGTILAYWRQRRVPGE